MKDNLDAVDSDIGVAEVVPLFGLFVKYTLKSIDQATSTCNCSGKYLARQRAGPSLRASFKSRWHLSCVLGMCYDILSLCF